MLEKFKQDVKEFFLNPDHIKMAESRLLVAGNTVMPIHHIFNHGVIYFPLVSQDGAGIFLMQQRLRHQSETLFFFRE